jgi:hypothetical protein
MNKFCPSCGFQLNGLPCPKCEPKDLSNSTIEQALDPDAHELDNEDEKTSPGKEEL